MKQASRKPFFSNESDYNGEFHPEIKKQITDR